MAQKKIILNLRDTWVLTKRNDDVLPIQAFIGYLKEVFSAEVLHASLTDCEVVVAPGLIKNRAVDAFLHQSYLFSINEGNGTSTYLYLFAQLLQALGLYDCDPKSGIREIRPKPPGGRDAGDPFSGVYSCFTRHKGGKQILCIDISDWMTNVTDIAFRQMLAVLESRMGDVIVVFRVPFVEKDVRDTLRRGIGDILFVRELSFVPFTREELQSLLEQAVQARGYTAEPEAMELFMQRLAEEKSDGRFYGINTVQKVIFEMLYRKQLYNAREGVLDTVIKKREILDLVTAHEDLELSGLEQLDSFVGMEQIKTRVEEIIAQIEMAKKNENLGAPCIHMRFLGNPGTGKTTVARIIGKVLREKGILRNGSFFEHAGRDFCGRYIGETAPKTVSLCRDAYGSVLFIDEAYSLYRSEHAGDADYGKEAIDTLIAQMENHRSDMVIIMAGYPEEMQTLMKANAGLESRMPYIVEFPNYTREQLAQIFMIMVKKSFTWADGFEEAVKEYFEKLPEELITSREFSNARFVRNLFERTWGKAVLRCQMAKDENIVLIAEDLRLAGAEREFSKMMEKPKQKRTLGFV